MLRLSSGGVASELISRRPNSDMCSVRGIGVAVIVRTSTSTRNFPNRLGNGANVYLASAELSAVAATLGYIPAMDEYMERMKSFEAVSADIYRYLNFDQIPDYADIADTVSVELT